MKNIKAIMFDYDGVLTLDKTATDSICNHLSKVTGADKFFLETVYSKYRPDLIIGKTSFEKIWGGFCLDIGADIPIEVLFDSFKKTPIDKDMHNLVKELKGQNYLTALITDNNFDRIKTIVKEFGLDGYFDVISTSGEIGSGKKTEEIFLITLEKLSIKANESIFIDNLEENLAIPRKIGIETIYFDDMERDICGLREKIGAILTSEP